MLYGKRKSPSDFWDEEQVLSPKGHLLKKIPFPENISVISIFI